jgi:hypothetical protein
MSKCQVVRLSGYQDVMMSGFYLDVAIVDRVSVEGPIVVALLPALLYAACEHHDGAGVGLPAHAPEVVPCGVQRALGHDELPLGVEAGHEAGVDEVAALLVIGRLQLDTAVVVRQDIGKPTGGIGG